MYAALFLYESKIRILCTTAFFCGIITIILTGRGALSVSLPKSFHMTGG
jgi:hypothetical protein